MNERSINNLNFDTEIRIREFDDVMYYIGSARTIKSLYRNMCFKTNGIPLYVDDPKFNMTKFYGIAYEKDNNYFYVIGESAVVWVLLDDMEKTI